MRFPVFESPATTSEPPDSFRKRRRRLRESEEASGEMTIEQYIYLCDPYHSTTVPNPMLYPFYTGESSSESLVSRIQAYESSILGILESYGFRKHEDIVFLVNDVIKANYPGGDVPVTTLTVMLAKTARGFWSRPGMPSTTSLFHATFAMFMSRFYRLISASSPRCLQSNPVTRPLLFTKELEEGLLNFLLPGLPFQRGTN